MVEDIVRTYVEFEEDLKTFSEDTVIIGGYSPTISSLLSKAEKLCKFYELKIPSLSRLLTNFKEVAFRYQREVNTLFGGLSPEIDSRVITKRGMAIVKEIRNYLDGDESVIQTNYKKDEEPEVFIIHGRRIDLARELYQLLSEHGLKGNMLQSKPNLGDTLIEKFERVSNNSVYAIAIITPDDIGGLIGETQKERGRQNVIFELGSFISKNRKKVCILIQGDLELPSDISGIAYHRFNNEIEEVSRKILKELSAAGIKIKF